MRRKKTLKLYKTTGETQMMRLICHQSHTDDLFILFAVLNQKLHFLEFANIQNKYLLA